MITNKTVVISCAGMGKRLGIGTTKALINVGGKPLIIRTLEQLSEVEDVRVVVGYQAEKVIDVVKQFRSDVVFVFNNDYEHNGTAASVCRALPGAREYILTIDGDLIVHPEDMKTLINLEEEFICGTKIDSDDAVLLSVDEKGDVVSFSRESGDYEWTGVCCIKTKTIIPSEKHVYQMLEPILPKKHLCIRTKEIDTLDDYYRAEKWIYNNFNDTITIGVLGGMGSYATLFAFEKILKMFPAEKEWERPRVIIDNNCTMPSRVRSILYKEQTETLISQMTDSLTHLISSGATDVILACNTSHVFLDAIYEKNPKIKRHVHHLVDLTAKYCKENGILKPYLIASEGTIISDIFGSFFKNYGLKINYNRADFDTIREFIECVKRNNISEDNKKNFVEFINNLGEETVILGCTELPIIYELCKEKINKKIINPFEIGVLEIKQKFDVLTKK